MGGVSKCCLTMQMEFDLKKGMLSEYVGVG